MENNNTDQNKRRLLGLLAHGSVWTTPLVASVVLPVHAQTSAACIADIIVGGNLSGSASRADNCQAACEYEADQVNAQLCAVTETVTAGEIDCTCELDLP